MGADALVAELTDALPGHGAVIVDPDLLAANAHDSAMFCEAGTPAVLVRPSSTEEVAAVVRIARQHRTPIVPQAARTDLSGAANAIDGCILMSMLRMDRILEVSRAEGVAVVQPGVTNAELSRAVLGDGMFYPPDPASWESSTIGGNISTNAGGLCCVKYGVTTDFVRGLEVVLGTGEVIRTGRRTVKGVAGYDLTSLITGSEGTLAIITEATVALRPAPEAALTMAATFPSGEQALQAVTDIMATGVRPSLMEFLDQRTARAIQDLQDMGLPADVGAVLLAQSDRGELAAADVAAMAKVCLSNGAIDVAEASDTAESEMLLQARRMVNAAVESLGTTLVDDVAVPRDKLPELLSRIREIERDRDVLICCPGHVGDGNMHPTVVFDRADEGAEERAMQAFDDVMRLGLDLGGTITGEHGVGLLKRDWLATELGGTSMRLHRGIKDVFDPDGILNPDKVLRPPG